MEFLAAALQEDDRFRDGRKILLLRFLLCDVLFFGEHTSFSTHSTRHPSVLSVVLRHSSPGVSEWSDFMADWIPFKKTTNKNSISPLVSLSISLLILFAFISWELIKSYSCCAYVRNRNGFIFLRMKFLLPCLCESSPIFADSIYEWINFAFLFLFWMHFISTI